MVQVNEIAGPLNLLRFVQEEINVKLAIRNRTWRRGANGKVLK